MRLSKKYYFFDKEICGLTAAHAPSAEADGEHVCRPRSIFFAAHVAEENDGIFFAPAGANSTRFFDMLSSSGSVYRFRSCLLSVKFT